MFTKSTFYFGISSEVLSWEGDQPWDFFGRNDAKAETPILWPPHAKSWLIGKDCDAGRDWGQEEKGTTENEMAGWHHGLDGRESGWTPGVGDGQGGLACCNSWGRKKSDMTERLNWTEVNWIIHNILALGVFSIMNLAPKAAELLYCHYFLFFHQLHEVYILTRDRTCATCIGRWSLSHWTTGESFTGKYLKKGEIGLLIWEEKTILGNFCLCSKVPGFSSKSVSRQGWFFTHVVNKVGL